MRHSQHPERCLPFDLHVLGLPLAFILSQDQTLHCKLSNYTQLIHKIYIPASLSFFLRLLFFRLTSLQRTCVAAFGNTVRKTASQPRFPRFFIFVFSVPSEQECKGSRSFSVCKKNLKKIFFLSPSRFHGSKHLSVSGNFLSLRLSIFPRAVCVDWECKYRGIISGYNSKQRNIQGFLLKA